MILRSFQIYTECTDRPLSTPLRDGYSKVLEEKCRLSQAAYHYEHFWLFAIREAYAMMPFISRA